MPFFFYEQDRAPPTAMLLFSFRLNHSPDPFMTACKALDQSLPHVSNFRSAWMVKDWRSAFGLSAPVVSSLLPSPRHSTFLHRSIDRDHHSPSSFLAPESEVRGSLFFRVSRALRCKRFAALSRSNSIHIHFPIFRVRTLSVYSLCVPFNPKILLPLLDGLDSHRPSL